MKKTSEAQIMGEGKIVPNNKRNDIISEAEELMAILTTCVKKVKAKTKGK